LQPILLTSHFTYYPYNFHSFYRILITTLKSSKNDFQGQIYLYDTNIIGWLPIYRRENKKFIKCYTYQSTQIIIIHYFNNTAILGNMQNIKT